MTITPRRSVLYIPSNNDRAIAKAATLDVDTVILDLEDAVAVSQKEETREKLLQALHSHDFGGAEIVIRVNALNTPWGEADLRAFANSKANAICIPKVESAEDVHAIIALLEAQGDEKTPLWVMAETPLGIKNIDDIVNAGQRICTLLMGTSDLTKDLRLTHSVDRIGLQYSLSRAVLAARIANIDIIDGVFVDLNDEEGFAKSCKQGLELGFDGKSLIHPRQIAIANETFSPSSNAIEEATEIVEAWEKCQAENSGVTVVRGKLVESLHVEHAIRSLNFHQAISRRKVHSQ